MSKTVANEAPLRRRFAGSSFLAPNLTLVSLALVSLALAACGGKDVDDTAEAACARVTEFEGCGDSCSGSQACVAGLYCNSAGECTAECTAEETAACDEGQGCSTTGRCISAGGGGGGGVVDGCPAANLRATQRRPQVVVLLDRSSSMTEEIEDEEGNDAQRWDFMEEFLVGSGGDGGFIEEFSDRADFSMTFYNARRNGGLRNATPDPAYSCPNLTQLPVSSEFPDAFEPRDEDVVSQVRAMFDGPNGSPKGGTPTAATIRAAYNAVEEPGEDDDPVIFLLATDGAPDTCEFSDLFNEGPKDNICRYVGTTDCGSIAKPSGWDSDDWQQAYQERLCALATTQPELCEGRSNLSVAQYIYDDNLRAVAEALDKNMRTYVVGVDLTGEADSHARALAEAGVRDNETAIYRNGVKGTQISDAFNDIIKAQVSCEADLEGGRVIGDACRGSLTINGEDQPLRCGEEWRLKEGSETVLEVLGGACDRLKNAEKPAIDAQFPCDVVAEAQ